MARAEKGGRRKYSEHNDDDDNEHNDDDDDEHNDKDDDGDDDHMII